MKTRMPFGIVIFVFGNRYAFVAIRVKLPATGCFRNVSAKSNQSNCLSNFYHCYFTKSVFCIFNIFFISNNKFNYR